MARPQRHTADLSPYPDLVVVYLGMDSDHFLVLARDGVTDSP